MTLVDENLCLAKLAHSLSTHCTCCCTRSYTHWSTLAAHALTATQFLSASLHRNYHSGEYTSVSSAACVPVYKRKTHSVENLLGTRLHTGTKQVTQTPCDTRRRARRQCMPRSSSGGKPPVIGDFGVMQLHPRLLTIYLTPVNFP